MFLVWKRKHDRLMNRSLKQTDTVIALAEQQAKVVADLRLSTSSLELEKSCLQAELRLANLRLDLAHLKIYIRDTQPDLAFIERLGTLEDPRS